MYNSLMVSNNTKIADINDANIYLANEFINDTNVYLANKFVNNNKNISSIYVQYAPYSLPFEQTRETLINVDDYKKFIDNIISRFRRSRAYKGYKAFLMSMGMNRCQILGNITSDMADIEMHHNFLTIFDIAVLISQHVINTSGKITSFDSICLLEQEHRLNNIPIVMLSKTAHEIYHDNPDFYIPMSMTFGKWWELLNKYKYGISLDIAYKVINYINNCQNNNELTSSEFFKIKNEMESWGNYNEYNRDYVYSNYKNNFNNGYINV